MKRSSDKFQPRTLSFTLIEMLAVITIIMILAGIIFTSFSSALRQTHITKARADSQMIKVALTQYYSEYGKWPSCSNGTQLATQADIIAVLGGNELTAAGQTCNAGIASANPKKMTFLSPGKGDTCGVSPNAYFIDPWGIPYNIAIDYNYDNQITSADTQYLAPDLSGCSTTRGAWAGRGSSTTINAGVAVWSHGPDFTNGWGETVPPPAPPGDPDYATGKDDVTTWK